jgi:hypothetical protein
MNPYDGKPDGIAAGAPAEDRFAGAALVPAAALELAHRQVERACEVEAIERKRPEKARAEPLARLPPHLFPGRCFAENGAREHVQHEAVVERLEPPNDEHREPQRPGRPAERQHEARKRNESERVCRVDRAPPAPQHREAEIHRLPRRAPAKRNRQRGEAGAWLSGRHARVRRTRGTRGGEPSPRSRRRSWH